MFKYQKIIVPLFAVTLYSCSDSIGPSPGTETSPKTHLGAERIVFEAFSTEGKGRRIHVMNPDGSGLKALTKGSGERTIVDGSLIYEASIVSFDPDWSPDANKIVYVSFINPPGPSRFVGGNGPPEQLALYTMNADGSDKKLILQDDNIIGTPSWSPSGEEIAFTLQSPSGKGWRIYVIGVDGTNLRAVTSGSEFYSDSTPSWSPEGDKILFRRAGEVDLRVMYSIYSINKDGSELTKIVDDTDQLWTPSWSGDGTKILYNEGHYHSNANLQPRAEHIRILDQNGSIIEIFSHVDNGVNQNLAPAWSPDNTRIVYALTPNNRSGQDLYVMNSDGSGSTNITAGQNIIPKNPKWGLRQ